ncbi:hypothetical protein [Sphingobacterium haloxyli]|uniref:Outer membrane protein beta-barrel domain-containing protein n=1 Tax=Sphingobacterium haloxyli TaxID=2100533 RepID=A0A2S9IY80_9SPHI|nr:hypothetical protein [Sphingobacterium haloxyli]PRD45483.1 hypothetical protein C5745_17995 [Sphingobacterium haloxyli]
MLLLATLAQAQNQDATTSSRSPLKSGFVLLHRLGVANQNSWSVDLGLASFSWYRDSAEKLFDVSFGVESHFIKPFGIAPKVNFDMGFEVGNSMYFITGGLDAGLLTDFSNNSFFVTPKVGFSAASIVRVYYGYHILQKPTDFPKIGNHRISLEINMAAFHNFKIIQ